MIWKKKKQMNQTKAETVKDFIDRYGIETPEGTIKNGKLHSPYDSHMISRQWEETKKRIYSTYGNACELCGDRYGGLEVHHNTYASFKNEHDNDLIILCKECHYRFHQDLGYGGKKLNYNLGCDTKIKCSLCSQDKGKLKITTTKQDHEIPRRFRRNLILCKFCTKITKKRLVRKLKGMEKK